MHNMKQNPTEEDEKDVVDSNSDQLGMVSSGLSSEKTNESGVSNRRQFLRATSLGLGGLALPSVLSTGARAEHRYNITLGEDRRIEHANFGRSLSNVDSEMTLANGFSNSNTIDNQAEALVEVASGVGVARYIADTGINFFASGEEPMTAEISTRGNLAGILESPLLADTRVALFLRVRNRNTNETLFHTNMFQRVLGSDVNETEAIDTGFSGSAEFDLHPQDNHIAWIRLVARVEVEGQSLGFNPLSDFGSAGRDAVFQHIDISFTN